MPYSSSAAAERRTTVGLRDRTRLCRRRRGGLFGDRVIFLDEVATVDRGKRIQPYACIILLCRAGSRREAHDELFRRRRSVRRSSRRISTWTECSRARVHWDQSHAHRNALATYRRPLARPAPSSMVFRRRGAVRAERQFGSSGGVDDGRTGSIEYS